jgi:predicted RNA-binding protein with PIN domain
VSRPDVAARLVGLDARAWAQLLRALRASGDLPRPVSDALGRPTGELSSGPPRRALCEAVAASEDLLALLRSDQALPASVHASIVTDEDERAADSGADDGAEVSEPSARTAERSRELRRALDDERRKREGADARASNAEARAEAMLEDQERLRARIDELEQEVVATRDAVEQAAARAERRSSARLEALERELATERSEHEASRRKHERTRSDLRMLRTELDELKALSAEAPRSGGARARDGHRPLVLPAGLDASTTEAARWLADRASIMLVDGYNAALMLRPGRPLEEQRRWLLERLRPLVVRGAIRPVVIFDGDGATGTLRETAGVEVRFTTGATIADDEIVFAVAATDDPVLVVTDDAELTRRVETEGGNVVGVIHLPGIIDA